MCSEFGIAPSRTFLLTPSLVSEDPASFQLPSKGSRRHLQTTREEVCKSLWHIRSAESLSACFEHIRAEIDLSRSPLLNCVRPIWFLVDELGRDREGI